MTGVWGLPKRVPVVLALPAGLLGEFPLVTHLGE